MTFGLVHAAVTQPLRVPVPADDAAYLRRKGSLKLALRTARRMLQFAASGQAASLRIAIEPHWKTALWIHDEAPQIGDALMDLAPRSLLHECGIAVDLLAPPHIAALFDGDRWLRRSVASAAHLGRDHDFVIASSHLRRALARKRAVAPALPWVSLAGYYTVPDYQRAMFTTRRLAELLGLELDASSLALHARQKLAVWSAGDAASTARARVPMPSQVPPTRIAIAVGGVRADRTYPHWPEVLASLADRGVRGVVLVGSMNGRAMADRIAASCPTGLQLDDRVGALDLHATQASLHAAQVAIAADGGLMHLALTTATPVVALFVRRIDPVWRLPPGFDGIALRAAGDAVGGIAPLLVADAGLRLAGRQRR